jgi:CheY-like chemotaxis protein
MNLKKRVLVIDDNQSLLLVVDRVLQKEGFEVITAVDGLEGLQRAQDQRPDLIIIDINMPKMNGYDVCRHLRQNPDMARTPVIFLSGRGNMDETIGPTAIGLKETTEAFACGGCDFLHKPVTADELVRAVNRSIWLGSL